MLKYIATIPGLYYRYRREILGLLSKVATLASLFFQNSMYITELPTLSDSAEDFLIFRENKSIRVHKFDNLPDSGNFLSIKLYVI